MALKQPGIVTLFKVYAGFMAMLGLITLVIGIVLALVPARFLSDSLNDPDMIRILGISLAVVGGGITVLPAVSFFTRNQPWAWGYNLAMLILGTFISCMTLIFPIALASIPLIFFWFKPEVRAYYDAGRGGPTEPEYGGLDPDYRRDDDSNNDSDNDGKGEGGDVGPPNPY